MVISSLRRKKFTGWLAAEAGRDGVFGAYVASTGSGGKPRVLSFAAAEAMHLDSPGLAAMAHKLDGNGSPWVFTLPRADYNLLVVPQPPVMAGEVEQSLRWSIANQIDFPAEEAAIAWMKIPTAEYLPNRAQHLYAAIARHETVHRYGNIFKAANLPLEAVDVYETAQRNIARLVGKPGEGIGLLRIGDDGVEFTVTLDGELYLDRFVEANLVDDQVGDGESNRQALERIVLQVQRSLDFVERHLPFINIRRLLLAPLARPLPVDEVISQNLSLPLERLDLATCFDFTRTPDLLKEENQARYFTTLGAALRFLD